MRSRLPRWRRGLTALALVASALGWGACEPLDLALFPVTPDASVPALVEVPAQPSASTQPDAGDDVQSDAGASLPPFACLPGATACESCVLAAACASGERCHPRIGGCVPSCAEGACPGSLVCDSLDVCVECRDDIQCAGASDEPHCDTLRGVCVECFQDEHCTDDPLERPACLATGICGCASNDDCSGGATCELDEAHCEIEDD
ncbi:MAG: hypothetical protein RL685_3154 [Pseudomonadota bacterium]|jgi:hypothetical protein